MSDTPSVYPKGLFSPKAWPSWLAVCCIWLLIRLPRHWLVKLSHIMAYPIKLLAARRRKIAELNLQICFPDLSDNERKKLVHNHFAAAMMGVLEMGMGWWLPDRKLEGLLTIEGYEHLERAVGRKKGVLLISPHFTCLEIIGRLFKMNIQHPWSGMYRPNKNPVVEYFFRRYRSSFFSKLIARDDMRSFIKDLKKNQIVWFATDQNFRAKGLVMAPFFGTPTLTNPGATRIMKLSGASIVPMGYHRKKDNTGYVIKFYPPPEGFPSEDEVENATKLNQAFETMILDAPEQYFWLHRKFKIRGRNEIDIYRQRGL